MQNGKSFSETAFLPPTGSSGIIHGSSFDQCLFAKESPIFRYSKLIAAS